MIKRFEMDLQFTTASYFYVATTLYGLKYYKITSLKAPLHQMRHIFHLYVLLNPCKIEIQGILREKVHII